MLVQLLFQSFLDEQRLLLFDGLVFGGHGLHLFGGFELGALLVQRIDGLFELALLVLHFLEVHLQKITS